MKQTKLGKVREKAREKAREKGYNVVIEELKKRITAISMNIKSYDGRCDQFRQNRLFTFNQQRLFQ